MVFHLAVLLLPAALRQLVERQLAILQVLHSAVLMVDKDLVEERSFLAAAAAAVTSVAQAAERPQEQVAHLMPEPVQAV
jgi:serine protease inhibitor